MKKEKTMTSKKKPSVNSPVESTRATTRTASSVWNSIFIRLLTYLLIATGLACLLFIVTKKLPFIRYFFEKESPVITLLDMPQGLGVKPQKMTFRVEDLHSGIELIRVKAEQASKSVDLYSQYLPLGTLEQDVEIPLDSMNLGLKRGMLKVTIEAFDRSLESNGAKQSFELPIRFDSPSIEIITTQHNAEVTGMEFVVYRVKSDSVEETGVRVGNKSFKGFPAEQFDPDLAAISDLYVSFYAIPKNYEKNSKLVVYASNVVGNTSEKSFYYRIRERSFKSWDYEVTKTGAVGSGDQGSIKSLLQGKSIYPEKLWKDFLIKPPGTDSSPRIGDTVNFYTDTQEKNSQVNSLFSFRTRDRSPVILSNPGYMLYSGELPGFSGVVMLDHGLGLVSVYAGLENVLPYKDTVLGSGENLGNATYLTHLKSNGFQYGLFFQGVPVRPEEWWDKIWVSDHVLLKIKEIKTRYNINTVISRDASDGVSSSETNTASSSLGGTQSEVSEYIQRGNNIHRDTSRVDNENSEYYGNSNTEKYRYDATRDF